MDDIKIDEQALFKQLAEMTAQKVALSIALCGQPPNYQNIIKGAIDILSPYGLDIKQAITALESITKLIKENQNNGGTE